MSAMSSSHPHFLPLLLPFSLVPPPKGKVFSPSLCLPIPSRLALPWPLPPARPQAPRSGSASSAALQHHPLPRSCFLWKAPQPNPAPAEVTGPPASSGAPWAGAGGAGSPHHTHTLAAKPIYTSPCVCLDGEMSGLTARQRTVLLVGALPARQRGRSWGSVRAQGLHPVPRCREHTTGICPRLVSPHLLQVKSTRKNLERGEGRLLLRDSESCWGSLSHLAGAQVTWQ